MTAQPVDLAPMPGDLFYDTTPYGLTSAERHAYRVGFDRGAKAYAKKHGGPAVIHDGDTPAAGTPGRLKLAAELAVISSNFRADRHPHAHKAGMSAVRAYLRKIGADDRLAEIVDPCAPVRETRKPAARKPRKLASVPAPVETADDKPADILAAGIESGRVVLVSVGAQPTPTPVTLVHRSLNRDAPAVMSVVPTSVTGDYVAARAARKAARRELAATMRAQGIRPTGDAWREACRAAGLSVEMGSQHARQIPG